MNVEDKISLCESLLIADSEITLLERLRHEDFFFKGVVRVNHFGEALEFKIWIPQVYPLSIPNADNISILFINPDLEGYTHVNAGGSICFHPEKDDDFKRKFESELSGLKKWIRKYYVTRSESDRYTYLLQDSGTGNQIQMLFTSVDRSFVKGDWGAFSYSRLSKRGFQAAPGVNKEITTVLRLSIDNDCFDNWSDSFMEQFTNEKVSVGYWAYIEDEPIIANVDANLRKSVSTWEQLSSYLPDPFLETLHASLKNGYQKEYLLENHLLVSLGYRIPSEESYEVHWNTIKVPRDKIPFRFQRERMPGASRPHLRTVCGSDTIQWALSYNLDYDRFFGRGRLSSNLVDSRIMIIGCGALGSSLAMTLARSGARRLILEDFDSVKAGNICRGMFGLTDIGVPKVEALKSALHEVSPFVSVTSLNIKMNVFGEKGMENLLNENVDIVIDCSADSEVSFILDKIDFKGAVHSLGITNGSNELILISNGLISDLAKSLFDLHRTDAPMVYEGAGCGYPTFAASFVDINSLLFPAISRIEKTCGKELVPTTAIVRQIVQGKVVVNDLDGYQITGTNQVLFFRLDVLDKILELGRVHYPKEFGGVLIGRKDEFTILVEDFLMPDEYENGKTIFVRHPGSLNERLEKIHVSSKGRIKYLGEWHSHPNAPAIPSAVDLEGMTEIANDLDVQNPNPILLIASIDKESSSHRVYVFDNKNLIEYERKS